MTKHDIVLIAGGGIAGLTLALALARRGIRSRVLERNAAFSEAGAGIQIGPNGLGVLRRLGIAQSLVPHATWPEAILVRDAQSGRKLARLPLGDWMARRHGEPYAVVHRGDLQSVLLDAVFAENLVEITTGFRVARITAMNGGGVVAHDDQGERARGSVLVGADGLWSTVRRWLDPEADLNYSGKTASRAVLPIDVVSPELRTVTGVWLSPGSHVVHYAIKSGTALAVVVVLDGEWPGRGWGIPSDGVAIAARLAGLDSGLLGIIEAGQDWRTWALYDPEPLSAWSRGAVTLIGDAAHPTLPFLAQGGVMALEDAETLAVCLSRFGADQAAAVLAYEEQRRPRVERLQRASRQNGELFHAAGLARVARDAGLSVLPGGLLMRRYDWLYGWTGPQTPA